MFVEYIGPTWWVNEKWPTAIQATGPGGFQFCSNIT
jgi:hypothetical protein